MGTNVWIELKANNTLNKLLKQKQMNSAHQLFKKYKHCCPKVAWLIAYSPQH
jgi:hypothetical protein